MRIALTKNMDEEKKKAKEASDHVYMQGINELLGEKQGLYVLKTAAALKVLSGETSPLVTSEEEANTILRKNEEQDIKIAILEGERQRVQKEIELAGNQPEIIMALNSISGAELASAAVNRYKGIMPTFYPEKRVRDAINNRAERLHKEDIEEARD